MSGSVTPSQTVGPFFQIAFKRLYCLDLAAPEVAGERVRVTGRVLDGDSIAVPDAILEIWQADSRGKYPHPKDSRENRREPGFRGFGRVATDENGKFCFRTIRPGSVPGPVGGLQAPHLAVSVFARGLLRRLVTRMYFPDEPANSADFALGLVPAERRHTLIARPLASGPGLEWNVILQGQEETVFFDC